MHNTPREALTSLFHVVAAIAIFTYLVSLGG